MATLVARFSEDDVFAAGKVANPPTSIMLGTAGSFPCAVGRAIRMMDEVCWKPSARRYVLVHSAIRTSTFQGGLERG